MVRPKAAPLLTAMLWATLACAASAQVTLRVPSQFNTIQDAIDAAPPGATVLIEPGTYVATGLDPGGREITIRGELGAQQTVLDGNLQGRIVHVRNDEGPGLEFVGLTFRRGMAPFNDRGGAMRIDGFAAPRVVDCVFEQNESALGGAAVAIDESAEVAMAGCTFFANVGGAIASETDGDVRLVACSFVQNAGHITFFAEGFFSGTLQLDGCVFDGNTPTFDLLRLQDISASLTHCAIRDNVVPRSCLRYAPDEPFQELLVQDCTLQTNQNERSTFEVFGSGDPLALSAPVRLQRCTFAGNTLTTGNARSCMWINEQNCVIEDCSFEGNTSESSAVVARVDGLTNSSGSTHFQMSRCRVLDNTTDRSAMVLLTGGTATVDNCLFARNQSELGPSAMLGFATLAEVSHCTFTDNHVLASPTGGALLDVPSLTSSIVYGNTPTQIEGTATAATWCDIEGGFAGIGNFDADPLLILTGPRAFRLGLGSPCVDAGAPGTPTSTLDLDGQPRMLGLTTDVGCDESTAQPLPGTDTDLLLTTTLDGQGDPLAAHKQAQVGQLLELRVQSLTGAAVGAWTLVLGELRPSGAPQPGFVLLPGMHLDVFSPGFFLLLDTLAIASPLGAAGFPAQGVSMAFAIPPGLSGNSVHLQSLGILQAAGFYAASNCHEIVLP